LQMAFARLATLKPGKSFLHLMISLFPGCHAKVHRTKAVLSQMPPLLLELWREQHPKGHEQTALEFRLPLQSPEPVPLFEKSREVFSQSPPALGNNA